MTPELVLDLTTRVTVKHSALRDFPRDILVLR
jgi:hypothetical protein